jgi:hypothetical protein
MSINRSMVNELAADNDGRSGKRVVGATDLEYDKI